MTVVAIMLGFYVFMFWRVWRQVAERDRNRRMP